MNGKATAIDLLVDDLVSASNALVIFTRRFPDALPARLRRAAEDADVTINNLRDGLADLRGRW